MEAAKTTDLLGIHVGNFEILLKVLSLPSQPPDGRFQLIVLRAKSRCAPAPSSPSLGCCPRLVVANLRRKTIGFLLPDCNFRLPSVIAASRVAAKGA